MTDVNLMATLILFVSASLCIAVANYLSYRMLREVNSRLPGNHRAGRFRFYPLANLKITRIGRRIYLAAIPRVRVRLLLIMAVASALACAWELGFFHIK